MIVIFKYPHTKQEREIGVVSAYDNAATFVADLPFPPRRGEVVCLPDTRDGHGDTIHTVRNVFWRFRAVDNEKVPVVTVHAWFVGEATGALYDDDVEYDGETDEDKVMRAAIATEFCDRPVSGSR